MSQLTRVEKTEINNSGCATPDFVTDQSFSDRIRTSVRKFNLDKYAEHKCLSACAGRKAALSLFLNPVIVLVPNLPQVSSTSHS